MLYVNLICGANAASVMRMIKETTSTLFGFSVTIRPSAAFMAPIGFCSRTRFPLRASFSARISGVNGMNGKNDTRPMIASSAGTSVRLANAMMKMATLNGIAKR
ncbi:hypothetical protein D3C86_1628210 [compost metagenome]